MTSTTDALNLTGIAPQATETPLYGLPETNTMWNGTIASATTTATATTPDTLVWAVVTLAALILLLATILKPR